MHTPFPPHRYCLPRCARCRFGIYPPGCAPAGAVASLAAEDERLLLVDRQRSRSPRISDLRLFSFP